MNARLMRFKLSKSPTNLIFIMETHLKINQLLKDGFVVESSLVSLSIAVNVNTLHELVVPDLKVKILKSALLTFYQIYT
jgi:hypothetical protein